MVVRAELAPLLVSTGKVLFQWNAAGHVPYQDSEQPRPASATTPWNWFYINAVHLDTDGNLLINARYAWAVYQVSLRTGNIIWVLGGKHSTFMLKAAPDISESSPSGQLLFDAQLPGIDGQSQAKQPGFCRVIVLQPFEVVHQLGADEHAHR